jgi:hypothetical protein
MFIVLQVILYRSDLLLALYKDCTKCFRFKFLDALFLSVYSLRKLQIVRIIIILRRERKVGEHEHIALATLT